jgi:hypothetical protein
LSKSKLFAWQGISFLVPDEWELAAAGGDTADGYCRLEDLLVPRCEIRWRHLKRGADLERIVSGYLGKLAREAKKRKQQVVSERDVHLPKLGKRYADRDFRTFAWHGSGAGYGVAWYCRRCERCVIIQVYGELDDAGMELLRSARDHDEGKGRIWSVYDFQFVVPTEYQLKRHGLVAGCLEFEFEKAKSVLSFKRFSLASRMLGGDLAAFAASKLGRQAIDYHGAPQLSKDQLHEYYRRRAFRKRRGLAGLLSPLNKQLLALAEVWYCPGRDKILLIAWQGKTANAPELDKLRAGVACH